MEIKSIYRPKQRNIDMKSNKALSTQNHSLLKSPEVAAMLGVSNQWLAKARITGESPPYVKFGKAHSSPVRYDLTEVKEWIARRTVDKS